LADLFEVEQALSRFHAVFTRALPAAKAGAMTLERAEDFESLAAEQRHAKPTGSGFSRGALWPSPYLLSYDREAEPG